MLLPGSLVLSGVALLIWRYGQSLHLYQWAILASQSDAILGGVVLLAASVLGGVLAAALEVFEWKCIDRHAAKALKITNELYDEEWYCYVESLKQSGNRYLSWKARFFMFQLRTGVALALLSVCWAVSMTASAEKWWGSGSLIVLAGAMLALARASHNLLADWRHRMFESEAAQKIANRTPHGEEAEPFAH